MVAIVSDASPSHVAMAITLETRLRALAMTIKLVAHDAIIQSSR